MTLSSPSGRIKESEVHLEEKIAEGAEGEVWRASLVGYEGAVAVKKAKVETNMKVWNEAEVWSHPHCRYCHHHDLQVAFMMSLKHERLVRFIGAGEMYSAQNQATQHVPCISPLNP